MPTISMFYGIVICLYFFDDERHKLPHIHAKYQGTEASFSILDASVLSGDIPLTKVRLVQAWIEFIENPCWPIGNLRSMVRHRLLSNPCGRRNYGICDSRHSKRRLYP